MPKVAIIGGGPSAISLCKQLCDENNFQDLPDELEITIFEKNSEIGGGLPYSFEDSTFILNLPKDMMEPVYRQKGHFSNWLLTQPDCPQNTQFPPRYFFGRYLKHVSKEIQDDVASKGIKIIYKTSDEVLDVSEIDKNLYEIISTTGTYYANYLVLSTGHMVSTNYQHLKGFQGYEHNPWDRGMYKRLNPNEDVAIIGTRLTAIDTALKLDQLKFKGKIHMVSRMGLLPAVLTPEIKTLPLRHLTLESFSDLTKCNLQPLKLEDLLGLFWDEIKAAEGPTFNETKIIKSSKDISAIDWLTDEIARAERNDTKWQQVLFSFYSVIPNIWSTLSFADQKRFLKDYYGLFMTYLAAFPLENARKIKSMLEENSLQVSGGLEDIDATDKGFLLRFKKHTTPVPQLINATGSGYQLSSVPLYQKMLSKHLITEHSLGGIKVNPQTLQVLDKTETPRSSIFAIGETTRGTCLMTADMSRISGQASRISNSLANGLLAKKPLPRHNAMFGTRASSTIATVTEIDSKSNSSQAHLKKNRLQHIRFFGASSHTTVKKAVKVIAGVVSKRLGAG